MKLSIELEAREQATNIGLAKALIDTGCFSALDLGEISCYLNIYCATRNAAPKCEMPNEEEVKQSRWENISGFDVCNICGTSPAYCLPEPNNPKGYPPYCHNCGSKMDGGAE